VPPIWSAFGHGFLRAWIVHKDRSVLYRAGRSRLRRSKSAWRGGGGHLRLRGPVGSRRASKSLIRNRRRTARPGGRSPLRAGPRVRKGRGSPPHRHAPVTPLSRLAGAGKC
jgi:hypothetical protein